MDGSRAEAGQVQDEPGTFCNAQKIMKYSKQQQQQQKDGRISQGHKESASTGQIWDNLRTKIIKASNKL